MHLLWNQCGTTVDNGICIFEACIANFLILVAVIAHIQVHNVIPNHDGRQQFTITLAGGLLVFLY